MDNKLKLPKHISMSININPHFLEYKTSSEWLNEMDKNECCYNYIDEEDKQKCISTNQLVSVVWYPCTPIGHIEVIGSSLEKILLYIEQQNL